MITSTANQTRKELQDLILKLSAWSLKGTSRNPEILNNAPLVKLHQAVEGSAPPAPSDVGTPVKFLASWIKSDLEKFISTLLGTTRLKGKKFHSITNSAAVEIPKAALEKLHKIAISFLPAFSQFIEKLAKWTDENGEKGSGIAKHPIS